MPYVYQVFEAYVVDADWLYCMASGIGQLDEDKFEAEVAATGIAEREDAIAHLLTPKLAAMGFQQDTHWNVLLLTEDYLEYEGFPLSYGQCYAAFGVDAIATDDNAKMPASKTVNYSPAAQKLVKALGIGMDELPPVTLISLVRQEDEQEALEEA